MVDSVWKTFKKQFETIQQEKADIACAELLQTEAQEKAKVVLATFVCFSQGIVPLFDLHLGHNTTANLLRPRS